ncbi:MAG: alpha/beta fold hydrolase [Bacteroidales bacterium]|nr:alpha/beta fold hydrolase [Bacteroidales bacterium]
MRKNLILFFALLLTINVFSQWSTKTMDWDNKKREYLMYVPKHYDASKKLAVVFALHPKGGKSRWIYGYGIAKTAEKYNNAIVISPQALSASVLWYNLGPCWNSGVGAFGYHVNSKVKDFDWMMAILDKCIADYNVDESRVYATGFSMGGYMCNRLAIQSNGRIKKIASDAGTVGNFIKFNPTTPVSVLHIHGTNDNTVQYKNNNTGMDAEKLVEKWVEHNSCGREPVKTVYPDKGDNITFERYDYPSGRSNAKVSFIKAIGGTHSWYRAANNDINYNEVIWDFFFGDEPADEDLVQTANLPKSVRLKKEYNFTLEYAAKESREIALSMWKGQTKLAKNVVKVKAGRGTANFKLKVSNGISNGDVCALKAEIRPQNSASAKAFDRKQTKVKIDNLAVPYGSIVWLKSSSNNAYVSTEKDHTNKPLEVDKTKLGLYEKYEIIDAGNGFIALKSLANGKYVCADKSLNSKTPPVVATKDQIDAWEKFKWVSNKPNTCVLMANVNRKFIKINPNKDGKPLEASANVQNQAEVFKWGETTKSVKVLTEIPSQISMNLFPNPASAVLNIELSMNNDEKVVMLAFNSLGQKVFSKNYGVLTSGKHHTTLNIENYESGLYTFVYVVGNSKHTKRVFIK